MGGKVFVPSATSCCDKAVAVRTSNLALVDFGLNLFDSRPARDQGGNRHEFHATNVVEFQNDGILLAAVHTRMLTEVVPREQAGCRGTSNS